MVLAVPTILTKFHRLHGTFNMSSCKILVPFFLPMETKSEKEKKSPATETSQPPMRTQQRGCGQGRQWGRGKGDRERERGRGHSDSEVERRDVPYNTAPKR